MKYPITFICSGTKYNEVENPVPAPYMRRSFVLEKLPETAPLEITAAGFYELFVNGQRITRGRLSSYISNPDKVLYYDEYNVTDYINHGENVIAVLLGNGFLNCVGGGIWDFDKTP